MYFGRWLLFPLHGCIVNFTVLTVIYANFIVIYCYANFMVIYCHVNFIVIYCHANFIVIYSHAKFIVIYFLSCELYCDLLSFMRTQLWLYFDLLSFMRTLLSFTVFISNFLLLLNIAYLSMCYDNPIIIPWNANHHYSFVNYLLHKVHLLLGNASLSSLHFVKKKLY